MIEKIPFLFFVLLLMSCTGKILECEGFNCNIENPEVPGDPEEPEVPVIPPIDPEPPFVCFVNSDCPENLCKDAVCENNNCYYVNKANYETCGADQLCYSGSCLYTQGACAANTDCEDFNNCTENFCIQNLCFFPPVENGSSCSEGKVCNEGLCSNTCYTDDTCDDSNECTSQTCDNFFNLGASNINSMYWDGTNWWTILSGSKLGKFDASFNKMGADVSLVENPLDIFWDGEYWWILTSTSVYKYKADWSSVIESINLVAYSFSLSFYLSGEYWYLSSTRDGGIVYKFNKDWSYTGTSFNIGFNAKKIFKKDNDWYLSTGNSNLIKKFSVVWEVEGDIAIAEIYQSQIIRSFFYANDTWNLIIRGTVDGLTKYFLYKFTSSFDVKSACGYSLKEDGVACAVGFCSLGVCRECSSNSHCDDSKVCTDDQCVLGNCSYVNKAEGSSCGSGKHCFAGECLSGCVTDADCPSDVFCNDFYCDQNIHECKNTIKNEGQYCAGSTFTATTSPIFVCNNVGACVFDSTIIGLCSEPVQQSSINPSFLIYENTNVSTNTINGEIIYAIGNKFDDNGVHKCGGEVYLKGAGVSVIFANFGERFNQYENVPGFIFGETYNLYVRTENYVCKVKGVYDTVEFPSCTNKWYPLCLAGATRFINIYDGDVINFADPTQCTFVGNAPPK